MNKDSKIAILGAGNIGMAIAHGLIQSGLYDYSQIILTRRHSKKIGHLQELGFNARADNCSAVKEAGIILIAVEPQNMNELLEEIRQEIRAKQLVISVVTGVEIKDIARFLGEEVSIVRAMPNTAISIRQSMTCLSVANADNGALKKAEDIFRSVGQTEVIDEVNMTAATALAACGIAFFLRAVRAASQGGIEIGFNADKALRIAAQTAKGAASLLLENEQHPEFEIDKVTTPRGVTISGLNQMEHAGFSSAMITGIVTSWTKASKLYKEE
ncbi:MAG TPA: pyrroline-5-carboxylate reductase [Caldithrix abyssi]|uniref:Pyrroline-5-carboxylate reductase n=1 Tax=Caldithrix abyssi TaxID=187145 RepID=A0A7V4U311_CALAY|nr:pyrroline-5-carboxylate reductase [Caldithrix abyssi]